MAALRKTGTALLAGLSLVVGGGWAAKAQAGCAGEDTACEILTGSYHIELPPAAGASAPAVLFLHGHGGSGENVMRNRAMVEALLAQGYAVIAPDALPRRGTRSWTFFPGWEGRDEIGFLQQVAADAAARFDLDRDDMVLAGFSAGAFMVNYLACANPEGFAAYAPIAGGFWRPQPNSCAGPIRLFHSHGWGDIVVPLEGRFLGGGRFQQGDIFAGLELWRLTNGCLEQAPTKRWRDGELLRRRWDCGPGADIEFLLYPQGHQIPGDWADWMLDWYEAEDAAEG